MTLVLQYVLNMVGLYGSKRARIGYEVNTILKSVKSCRISGSQASGGILQRKKWSCSSRMCFVLENISGE